MRPFRATLIASTAVSALCLFFAHSSWAGPAEDAQALVEKLPEAKGAEFWTVVSDLEAIGPQAVPALTGALKSPEGRVRLGAAKAIYRCGEKKEGVAVLMTLIGEKNKEVRRQSADVLADLTRNDANFGNRKEIVSVLQEALDASDDQKLTLALSRALWSIDSNIRATDELKKLLTAKDGDVRRDAALALAESDDFDTAMPHLKRMSAEPGERGALARLYIKHKNLQDSLLRKAVGNTQGGKYALLEEMIEHVEKFYVDPKKADEKLLLEGAARGIAEVLDPHSTFLNEKDLKDMTADLNKRYGGIGAHVSTRDDFLTIERPVYSGPAYRAGLRTLDRIVEIEGQTTYKRPVEDCVTRLRGEPGTRVKIKVGRRGWAEPREFELERAEISIRTAQGDMLPGKVGWIQITSFGSTTNDEMRESLDALLKDGAVALIIDLRNNGGGLLPQVVKMVDRFVPAGKVICTTKDRQARVLEELKSEDDATVDIPVVVLINEGSASASEIMSGALQDFQVATIIGERSYGKGSVQRIIPLRALKNSGAFKYTFAKYYLPSGRSIHIDRDRYGKVDPSATGGVVPDIEVKLPERDLWKEFEFARILDSGKLDAYVDGSWEQNREAFTRAATDTAADPAAFPGFDALYDSLKAKAEKIDVAQLVRQHVRRKLADERKREHLVDLNVDTQAQRAVIEVLRKAKVDADTVAEYKPFAHAFDAK
ncbi:MAG: hypothetical protein HUU15_14685 [Candidatus Brocadiae bacterium]|nr:hypothetical protein [Candidatus Brocadiia bacterium]